MSRKLMVKRDGNPRLDDLSSDGEGPEFGQPLSNQEVPTGYPTLPNPDVEPPFDRKHPDRPRNKALGFEPRPKNFNDLTVGDGGAGVSNFRRVQLYMRTAGPLAADFADAMVYDVPIQIATARSADTRPRFFHVSFFAVAIQGGNLAGIPNPPAPETTILSTAGLQPTNTVLKGRVQVYDESGSRFFDVNVHGSASYSVYAWGITTFLLLPSVNGVPQGYEVNVQAPDSNPQLTDITENALATGRIIPTFQNVTQITDQATRTVSVPAGGDGFISIPPGARRVRIRANIGVAAVSPGYNIYFSVISVPGRAGAMGRIVLLPGRLESQLVDIPNAPFIIFDAAAADPAVEWVATFVVEA